MSATATGCKLFRFAVTFTLVLLLVGSSGSIAATRLYKVSLDQVSTSFQAYDPDTDTWTTLTDFDTGAQMAADAAGALYAWNRAAGEIQVYDPATDTWSFVSGTPPGASGDYGNLEIRSNGEFLYTESGNPTLFYTVGGVWQTFALGFTPNATGDYDPASDEYVVGQWATFFAHRIDVATLTVTGFTTDGNNQGERMRCGTILDGSYYYQASTIPVRSYDLSDPLAPFGTHGAAQPFYSACDADHVAGLIYLNELGGVGLKLLDPSSGTETQLAPGAAVGNHSSVRLAQSVEEVPTLGWTSAVLLGGLLLLGLGLLALRRYAVVVAPALLLLIATSPADAATVLDKYELGVELSATSGLLPIGDRSGEVGRRYRDTDAPVSFGMARLEHVDLRVVNDRLHEVLLSVRGPEDTQRLLSELTARHGRAEVLVPVAKVVNGVCHRKSVVWRDGGQLVHYLLDCDGNATARFHLLEPPKTAE